MQVSACGGHKPREKLCQLLSSCEGKVQVLVQLLRKNGALASDQLRERLRSGQPVQARGHQFSKEEIREALRLWEGITAPEDPMPEPVPEPCRSEKKASLQGFMEKSRRRSLGGDGDGFLTRTWLEMAEARRAPGRSSEPSREDQGNTEAAPESPPAKRQKMEQVKTCPRQEDGMPESVKELKVLLTKHGIDFSNCVEKSDLQELLRSLKSQPTASAALKTPSPQQKPTPLSTPEAPAKAPTVALTRRDREAQEEVLRILPLQREAFKAPADWAFQVLAAERHAAAVQRSYRNLMRKLHPDKVAVTEGVERATAMVREAKDLCERSLSKTVAPMPPRCLRYEILNGEVGRRRYRLHWMPPEMTSGAPVCRYLVAALDPAYGKALTITVLEPDYSEELKRFVSVEELNSFVLAEQELQKMPSLWKQPTATVQVCAANAAGQSAWSKLEVRLMGRPSLVPTSPSSSSESASSASGQEHFDSELQQRQSNPRLLRQWLQKQLKPHLASWLRAQYMPACGNKQDLIERVEEVLGLAR